MCGQWSFDIIIDWKASKSISNCLNINCIKSNCSGLVANLAMFDAVNIALKMLPLLTDIKI